MRPKGFKHTQETKERISSGNKRGKYFKCLICKKEFWVSPFHFSKARFCSRSCKGKYWFTKINPNYNPEVKEKMRLAKLGKPLLKNRGSGNHQWRGGITAEHLIIRHSVEYKNWRKGVFTRDKYKCQECGNKSGKHNKVYIVADHIKPFSLYPELRLKIDNGRTLCYECHKKTDTFAGRIKNYKKT